MWNELTSFLIPSSYKLTYTIVHINFFFSYSSFFLSSKMATSEAFFIFACAMSTILRWKTMKYIEGRWNILRNLHAKGKKFCIVGMNDDKEYSSEITVEEEN